MRTIGLIVISATLLGCDKDVQSTRIYRFLKTIRTLSSWYSLDSSHEVLSDECARVSVIFQFFFHHFIFAKLATRSNYGLKTIPVLSQLHVGYKPYTQYHHLYTDLRLNLIYYSIIQWIDLPYSPDLAHGAGRGWETSI